MQNHTHRPPLTAEEHWREPQQNGLHHMSPGPSDDMASGSDTGNSKPSIFMDDLTSSPPPVELVASRPVPGHIAPDTYVCIGQLQAHALVNNDVQYEELLDDDPPWAWVHTQHEHLAQAHPLQHIHHLRHPLHIIHILSPEGTSPPRTLAIVEPQIASVLGPLLRDRTVSIQACVKSDASHVCPFMRAL
jgi:hypothetical protein